MRKSVLFSLFSVLLLLGAGPAWGQSATGSIVGTVLDIQGLPVDGVTVTLTNLGTNFSYTSASGSSGGYQFQSVDYGYYRLSATKVGFKAEVVNNIKLDAATQYSVPPITLEVGATQESVTVEAGAELVNTTSAEVTSTVEKAQIEQKSTGAAEFGVWGSKQRAERGHRDNDQRSAHFVFKPHGRRH